MSRDQNEVQRREALALRAIRKSYGTDDGEYGATLFVSHHLEELSSDYWQKCLGSTSPDPQKVLDLLVLRSHWSDEDEDKGIDFFDFTLTDGATNYIISVAFDEDGQINDITMES